MKRRPAAASAKGANGRIDAPRYVLAGFLIQAHAVTLNSEGARRQVEANFQAPLLTVGRPRRPAMGLYDLSGDGEPDAFAAGIAVARLGDPIKRLKNALQIPAGTSRALIPNQNHDAGF